MPYKIVKRGGRYAVVKKDGSKTYGTHASPEQAKEQLRALYANTPASHLDRR
jgi:hypothetical protein